MYRTRDLVDLAQKGIPEKYRVEIWMVYTGMSKVGKGVQSRCMQTNFNLARNILHSTIFASRTLPFIQTHMQELLMVWSPIQECMQNWWTKVNE